MTRRVRVAGAGEIADGRAKQLRAGSLELTVHRAGDRYYATEPLCPHRGGALEEGFHDAATVTCKLHGWQFDLATGCSTNIPNVKLKTYAVTVEEGELFVELGE